MVYQAYGSLSEEEKKQSWLSISRLCRIMRCSTSGYYEWKKKYENPVPSKRTESDNKIKTEMTEIIRALSFIPGTRTFRTELWRRYDTVVSRKRLRRLMREMNLFASLPHKDAYKGQATHNHPLSALQNIVNRNFGDRPRQVILTDITYLYYGKNRSLYYLCAFIDAYTKVVLGWAMSKKMDVALVKEAYEMMKELHGSELNNPGVLIHSDQGSQYTSTTFRQILSDDQFVQSVSRRGNSQDNAPMESFFGRMKTHILSLIALCEDYEKAVQLVNGYLEKHNNEFHRYELAGLTPHEFYLFCITGIYPCESYYGVRAEDLMPIEELVKIRLEKKEEKKRKRAERKAEETSISPASTIARDQKKVRTMKRRWEQSKENAETQLAFLNGLEEQINEAAHEYSKADRETKESLKHAEMWQQTYPYNYVMKMNGMY